MEVKIWRSVILFLCKFVRIFFMNIVTFLLTTIDF